MCRHPQINERSRVQVRLHAGTDMLDGVDPHTMAPPKVYESPDERSVSMPADKVVSADPVR